MAFHVPLDSEHSVDPFALDDNDTLFDKNEEESEDETAVVVSIVGELVATPAKVSIARETNPPNY